jgi:hypothetical protein
MTVDYHCDHQGGKRFRQGRLLCFFLTELTVLLLSTMFVIFMRSGSCSQVFASEKSNEHQIHSSTRQHYGIFVGVLSSAANVQARQAIRETWGADSRLLRVVFVTLRPASNNTLAQLQAEAVQHGDLLVVSDISDNYYNITYATIAVFKAAVAMGPPVKFVLKTDDDCYIRVPKLLDALHDAPLQLTYAGYPLKPARLHRSGKYAITWSMWPGNNTKVIYAWGAGYVLSIDLARMIAAGAPHQLTPQMVQIEDMAVGLWVEGLAQQHNLTINYHYFHYNMSCDAEAVASHLKEKTGAKLRCIHQRQGQCCNSHVA